MKRIAVNGFGTIGKRLADAVDAQPDMEVSGVTKTRPNYEADLAVERGYDLYAATEAGLEGLGDMAEGSVEELLVESDLVFDCSPTGIGARNRGLYEDAGIAAVYQGGEPHDVAGFSFNAAVNFDEAVGRDAARVVSCNTTGLCRSLFPLVEAFGVGDVSVTLVRRGGDPKQTDRGPINAIVPSLGIPSHHGPDVAKVIPGLDVHSMAVKVPTTLMHLHAVSLQLESRASRSDVLDVWETAPRVMQVDGGRGIGSTAELCELGRDMLRPRYDLWELALWKDSVTVEGDRLSFFQGVHQESIVVPENIDAARALLEMADSEYSTRTTDDALGVIR
ncbi:MAG: Glyceraldehyde-3-phosphate dehydrogenase [Methanonatronarchaeales archaeon]|nr:Glyceraldehyde-3-phosphate dehydrogenase [Methanonatronarchaeales archaeon]